MSRYASETSVSCESSRGEIERTLSRYGATSFMYGINPREAMIGFEANKRQIIFHLPLPDRDSIEFKETRVRRHDRSPEEALKAWEQACQQRWRALALAIKAKLEAVECGITTFEEEFLAHIVLPRGGTVAQYILPRIAEAYETGQLPPLLPMLTGPGSR